MVLGPFPKLKKQIHDILFHVKTSLNSSFVVVACSFDVLNSLNSCSFFFVHCVLFLGSFSSSCQRRLFLTSLSATWLDTWLVTSRDHVTSRDAASRLRVATSFASPVVSIFSSRRVLERWRASLASQTPSFSGKIKFVRNNTYTVISQLSFVQK